MALEARKLSKSEKAAILLLCLDENTASSIFNHMRDEEVREIGRALQSLSHIPVSEVQATMAEFYAVYQQDQSHGGSVSIEGSRAVERLLSKTIAPPHALGGATAAASVVTSGGRSSFGGREEALPNLINSFEPKMLFKIIKDEHPQLIAIILSMAKIKVAKAVLGLFEDEQKGEIVGRMAKLQEIPEAVVAQLQEFFNSKKSSAEKGMAQEERRVAVGGIDRALKVLKSIPPDQSVAIINVINEHDEQLGWEIEKQMLTIEDLTRADSAGMRELLRSIPTDDLKIAIKDSPDHVKEVFFGNMSSRASMILKEDMEVLAPQRVEDVERAQKTIIAQVKRLISEGKLKLASLEEDIEA